MRLLGITKSPRAGKKWRATFDNAGRRKHTDFGASGYQDLTQHHDEARAKLYRSRHKKDLDTKDPTRAGFLSYYLLWHSPDFAANVRHYKKLFRL